MDSNCPPALQPSSQNNYILKNKASQVVNKTLKER